MKCPLPHLLQADASSSDAEAQAKKKILKLTRKLQQPGVLPEKRARLLFKIEGSLSELDSLPSKTPNGNTSGEQVRSHFNVLSAVPATTSHASATKVLVWCSRQHIHTSKVSRRTSGLQDARQIWFNR